MSHLIIIDSQICSSLHHACGGLACLTPLAKYYIHIHTDTVFKFFCLALNFPGVFFLHFRPYYMVRISAITIIWLKIFQEDIITPLHNHWLIMPLKHITFLPLVGFIFPLQWQMPLKDSSGQTSGPCSFVGLHQVPC